MLMLLAGGDRLAAQELWLRKVRIHLEAPQGAGASAPKAAQQVAGRRPKPAPARAQAVPKPRTAAQLASRERSQKRLNQKHLARKMWASVRVASRLLAWLIRARACHYFRLETLVDRLEALDEFVERSATLGLRAASRIPQLQVYPDLQVPLRYRPILIGRLLVQQWPAQRPATTRAGIARLAEARRQPHRPLPLPPPPPPALLAPPTSSAAAAHPLPALALAAPLPPSQQPPSALAAAARAALDACELQDDRGSKRDALARTPPRPAAAPPTSPPPAGKRVRAGGLGAAFAAATPPAAAPQPPTATTHHAAPLVAANPYHPLA